MELDFQIRVHYYFRMCRKNNIRQIINKIVIAHFLFMKIDNQWRGIYLFSLKFLKLKKRVPIDKWCRQKRTWLIIAIFRLSFFRNYEETISVCLVCLYDQWKQAENTFTRTFSQELVDWKPLEITGLSRRL